MKFRISDTVIMKNSFKKFWTFSIALGERTVAEDVTRLLVCICSINGNLKMNQELKRTIFCGGTSHSPENIMCLQ